MIGNLVSSALSPLKHLVGKPEPLPAYKESAGPWSVETQSETYVDEARDRKVPLKIYSPEGAPEGSSPVVVLSHGLAGNALTYRYLGRHLASHGYTVLQPTHVGSDTAAVLKRTPLLAFQPGELLNRVEDVRFTLDLMDENKLPESVEGRLDRDRVALVGHSFGALTAQAMAGLAVEDAQGQELDVEDSRIKAFVAMSPFGNSFPSKWLRIQPDTYDRVESPILYMSGEHDRVFTLGKGPGVHAEPFAQTASEDKAQLTIGGGFHLSFAQVLGKVDSDTCSLAASTTTAFLDAHLKEEPEARAYLSENFVAVANSRGSTGQVASARPSQQ